MLSTVGRRAKKEVAPTRQHCYQAHPRSATNPALACVSELDPRLSLGIFTITYVESGVNSYFSNYFKGLSHQETAQDCKRRLFQTSWPPHRLHAACSQSEIGF